MAQAPNLLERVAFRLDLAPALVLDVLGAATLRVVHLALRLGVFEGLRAAPATAEGLAARLGTDPRATRILLDTLAAGGYLERSGATFRNSRMTERWLLPGPKAGMRELVVFWEEVVFPFWQEQAEEAVRRGRPQERIYGWMDRHPGAWASAQAWFAAHARGAVAEVVRRTRIPAGAAALLDVGGGHGEFTAGFCRAHPGLRATLLDLPEPLKAAEATLAREGLEGRVTLRSADYTRDDLGTGFDVVLLFNVVHAHLPKENEALLRKVHRALKPGGQVLVLEQLRGLAPGPVVKAMVEVVGFNYLAVLGGQAYAKADVEGWLRAAGFEAPKAMPLRSSPGNTLLRARKA